MAELFGISGAFSLSAAGTTVRSIGPIPVGTTLRTIRITISGSVDSTYLVAAAISSTAGADAANLQGGTPVLQNGNILQDEVRAFRLETIARNNHSIELAMRMPRITQTSWLITSINVSALTGVFSLTASAQGEIQSDVQLALSPSPLVEPPPPPPIPPGGGISPAGDNAPGPIAKMATPAAAGLLPAAGSQAGPMAAMADSSHSSHETSGLFPFVPPIPFSGRDLRPPNPIRDFEPFRRAAPVPLPPMFPEGPIPAPRPPHIFPASFPTP